jgi:hypothetical protein
MVAELARMAPLSYETMECLAMLDHIEKKSLISCVAWLLLRLPVLVNFVRRRRVGLRSSVCEQVVPLSVRDLIFTFTLGYTLKLDCCSRLRADRIHQAKSVGYSY